MKKQKLYQFEKQGRSVIMVLHAFFDEFLVAALNFQDIFFDNGKMLKTGFKPHHSLETVFAH